MPWAVPSLDPGPVGVSRAWGGPPRTQVGTSRHSRCPARKNQPKQLLWPPGPPKTLPEGSPGAPFSVQEADGLPSVMINRQPHKPLSPSHNGLRPNRGRGLNRKEAACQVQHPPLRFPRLILFSGASSAEPGPPPMPIFPPRRPGPRGAPPRQARSQGCWSRASPRPAPSR